MYFSRDRSGVYQLEFLIANKGHQLHSLRWKNILFQGFRLRVQAWTAHSHNKPGKQGTATNQLSLWSVSLHAPGGSWLCCHTCHSATVPVPCSHPQESKPWPRVSGVSLLGPPVPWKRGIIAGGGGLCLLLNSALPPSRKTGWREARRALSIAVSFIRFSKGPWPWHFCQKRLWITVLDYL